MEETSQPRQNNLLYSYEAREFEKYERSVTWYIAFSGIGILLLIYAIISRSPLMFIVFFLLFIIIIVISNKDPQTVQVDISKSGIILDKKRMFRYQDIEAFGVYVDGAIRYISLYLENGVMQYARIPLGTEDPEEIADLLAHFIVREDGRERITDQLDHILKI